MYKKATKYTSTSVIPSVTLYVHTHALLLRALLSMVSALCVVGVLRRSNGSHDGYCGALVVVVARRLLWLVVGNVGSPSHCSQTVRNQTACLVGCNLYLFSRVLGQVVG